MRPTVFQVRLGTGATNFRETNHDRSASRRYCRHAGRRWPAPPSRRIIRDEAAATGPIARNKASKAGPTRSRAARACSRCCRAMPSPSTASTRRTASLPIRRPPERSRCSISRASVRRRCSTRPTCVQDRQHGGAAGDLCVQWRARRGFGVPPSRTGRSAHRRVRHGRARRRRRPPRRQSGHLARLHRSGADRSGRHRLEPAGQARRRQRVLGRARRRRVDGEGHRALRRQERPRQLAEIHPRRKLRRLPRRQGRARRAERAGHRGFRNPDAVADARRRIPVRRRPLRARRRVAAAVARGRRTGAQGHFQQGGAGRRPSISR